MIRSIVGTVGTRVAVTLLNLGVVMAAGHALGAAGVGTISLIVLGAALGSVLVVRLARGEVLGEHAAEPVVVLVHATLSRVARRDDAAPVLHAQVQRPQAHERRHRDAAHLPQTVELRLDRQDRGVR